MINKEAETKYILIPELAQRWSPRAFGKKMVEDEKLHSIFEAARWGSQLAQ
ncbi:MAG: hypothetical protein U5L96_20865 [Owenweeksia sp.]|nr:hypothetical protein [Owenweeksia sp.]